MQHRFVFIIVTAVVVINLVSCGPADSSKVDPAQQRMEQAHNLREIGYDQENFRFKFRQWPNNDKFGDGQAVTSWRLDMAAAVHDNLYNIYDRHKPWDDPANAKALEHENKYTAGIKDGNTCIMVFTGEHTLYPPDGLIEEVTDGGKNTIFTIRVGADKAAPWTKPTDLVFDADNPLACLGNIPDEGLLAVFLDFKVRVIPKAIDPDLFRRLVNPVDGEPVDISKLEVVAIK